MLCWLLLDRTAGAQVPPERELVDLTAFARLYGVVRFFHPSDEAAAADWDRIAVAGVARARAASDDAALREALLSVFAPIAPTVDVRPAGQPATLPPPPRGVPVAWHYRGPDLEGVGPTYGRKRTNRPAPTGDRPWAPFAQRVDVRAHRGEPFVLGARGRSGEGVELGAWARVDLEGGGIGAFDNMADRLVQSREWTPLEVRGVIDPTATELVVGGLAFGPGEAAFDAFSLTVGGAPIALPNASFEAGDEGWQGGDGFRVIRAPDAPDGGAIATIEVPAGPVVRRDLFGVRPTLGDAVEVPLTAGLVARVPLVLGSTRGREPHTLPLGDPSALAAELAAVPTGVGDRDVRAADVVVAWAVLAQFYPYFEELGIDADALLGPALEASLDDVGPEDHERTLQGLLAGLVDGHAGVSVPGVRREPLPVRFVAAEGRLLAMAGPPALAPGDLVTALDGVPAETRLAEAEARYSGTPQWRRERALQHLGDGPPGSEAILTVDRGAVLVDVVVQRGGEIPEWHLHPPLGPIGDGAWYVDLARTTPEEIEAHRAELAAAARVVVDVRGYPNGTHGLLLAVLPGPEADRWMHVARLTRPAVPGSARAPAGWEHLGWDLRPSGPPLTGRVMFLMGGGSISYAESILGYPEALGLDLVGGPTAGANGNIVPVTLPSGARFTFTGMRVTRHDGTRSHAIGILPTVPVAPTITGLRAGRDEVVEAALAR